MNGQLGIAIAQLIAQFVQPLLASRDEHERLRAVRQLSGKLAANSRRRAGDQCGAAFKNHFLFVMSAEVETSLNISGNRLNTFVSRVSRRYRPGSTIHVADTVRSLPRLRPK